MNNRTKKYSFITSCLMMLLGVTVLPQITSADDLTVSGNGADSNNAVNVTTTQQTTTQQTNTAQVTNNATTTASTGNNTATNNSGNATTVKTGDATANTIVNTTANASSVNQNCGCAQDTTATITGNGANSANTVDTTGSTLTNVSVNQYASITNNITQNAITGENSANNNNGNVTIKTGDISASISVKNGPLNIANVSVPSGTGTLLSIKISGNGAGSVNTVTNNNFNTTTITVNNSADVINNLKANYLTGDNSANGNNGDVTIETGNVLASIAINNVANESTVAVNCGCQKPNKPTPPPAPTPQPTNSSAPSSSSSSSSNTSGSSGGGSGSVLGASATNSLPVTGGSYWFFIALIGNILMMLLGGYLRLRSGRSPGVALAL